MLFRSDSVTGQLEHVDRYYDAHTSGASHRTSYLYDRLGRRGATIQKVAASKYQVTVSLFDTLGRVVETRRAVTTSAPTDYTSLAGASPATGYARTSQAEYDSGGVGDGHVTLSRRYYATNDYTGVAYHRTYRGHLRGIEPFYGSLSGTTYSKTPVSPYTVQDVDWQGRVTATAQFIDDDNFGSGWSTVMGDDDYAADDSESVIDTNRRSLAMTLYDDLGRVYQVRKYFVGKGTSTAGGLSKGYLKTDYYYDRNGRRVASCPGYSAATEMAYDGAGRQYMTRTVLELESTKYSSGAFQYRDPLPKPGLSNMSGGDDKVIEMTHWKYEAAGNVTDRHHFEMNHDDTSSPGIDLTEDDDYVRSSVFTWYDAASRATTSADYGCDDGSATGAGSWSQHTVPSQIGRAHV